MSSSNVPGQDEPKDVLSNVEKNGEWKSRPIAVWGVLKSFLGQLSIGEITKTSLPAELCYPYSMLEMVGFRQLSLFKELFGVNEEKDALKRFLMIVKYFVCLPRQETHNKKPWNPILGETHMAQIYDDVNGHTEFISEQISHHPPVSAFNVRNDVHSLEVKSNLSFGVKFTGNSAGISVAGGSSLHLNKLNETYTFSKCIPAMLVRNVVFGTKYIIWEGECLIQCPETGFEAKITFKEGWTRNTVLGGQIYHKSAPNKILYTLDGNCGGDIKATPKDPSLPEKAKFSLINVAAQVCDQIHYLTQDKLEPMSSVIVWGPANAGILHHNMEIADAEKHLVEVEQRRLRAERASQGKEFEGHYFRNAGDLWVLRDGFSIKGILSGEIPTISLSSYSAKGDHLNAPAHINSLQDATNNLSLHPSSTNNASSSNNDSSHPPTFKVIDTTTGESLHSSPVPSPMPSPAPSMSSDDSSMSDNTTGSIDVLQVAPQQDD